MELEPGARILFISYKIVIRGAILLPGRGGILLKVFSKYPNLLNGVGRMVAWKMEKSLYASFISLKWSIAELTK